MEITVERSGGFAGLRSTTRTIATDRLESSDRTRVESLAGDLSADVRAPEGADQFQYDLTVTRGDDVRTYRFYGEENAASDLISEVFRIGT